MQGCRCAVIAKDNADEILQLLRSVEPFEIAFISAEKKVIGIGRFVCCEWRLSFDEVVRNNRCLG